MTVMISVEMPHYRKGKRVKKMYPHNFTVSEKLYDFLYANKNAENWNHHFSIEISKKFVEALDKLCLSISELDFLKDVKKVYNMDTIFIERIFIKNRFDKIVEKVDLKNRVAYFKSKKGKLFDVVLSDRVIYEGIKEKDEVEITILQNNKWLVTGITKSYDEELEKQKLEQQKREIKNLFGDY